MSSSPSPGRILLTLSQLLYSLGSFIADFNETHVLNPRWPPHARFHNGQTMSLAVLLCLSSLYYLWRPKTTPIKTSGSSSSGSSITRQLEMEIELEKSHSDLLTSSLIGSLYSLAGLSAIWYPGSDWLDPEFIRPGEPRRPQFFLFTVILGSVWLGWGLEGRRLWRVAVGAGAESGGRGKGKAE